MELLIRALDDLKETVLPKDPQLFAAMSEGPMEAAGAIATGIRGLCR
jgi:hypothetical protein